MAFGSTPGKHHLNHGESTGSQGDTGGKTMFQMVESDVAASCRHASLISHELQAERSPDGVLETLLHQQEIGCAKPVILIAAEAEIAVDVLAAQGLLEIEWNRAGCRIHGLGQKKTNSDRSVQIPRARHVRALLARRRALIRPGQRAHPWS